MDQPPPTDRFGSGPPEPPSFTPPAPPGRPAPPSSGFPTGAEPPQTPAGPQAYETGGSSGSTSDAADPQPGELHLKERRSWKTWQLVLGVLLAAFVGMAINGNVGNASTTSGSGASSYKLPPPSSTGSSTTTAPTGGGARGASGSSTTTTTAAGGAGSSSSTTTTAPGGAAPGGTASGGSTTGTTQPVGQESYLVPEYQSSGNWTSPTFNIAGSTWYVGWAFQCNPVPAVKPTFSVYVVSPPGSSPSGSPAVTSNDPQGQSVTNLTTTGSQQLVVQAPPQCKWAVKVTGYGGT